MPAQAGADLPQSSSAEKDLGLWVDHELPMSWQCPCGQEGQCHPGVHWEGCGQKVEGLVPLFGPGETVSEALRSSVQERQGATGQSPAEGLKDDLGSGASLL